MVASIRSSVVLPAPFGPKMPNTSPGRHDSDTLSTARIVPRFLSMKTLDRC
jgi:hypothetical protein